MPRRLLPPARTRSVGCAVVKDLVRPEAVTLLNNEIVERKHTTHFSTQVMNPYFHTEVNDEFPSDHPVNTFLERSSGFIPGDSWEPGCATDVMFRAPNSHASSPTASRSQNCTATPIRSQA